MRGFDAFKRLTGRKRHLVVDTKRLLLAVCVTPANVSETAGAMQVFDHLRGSAKKLRLLWCDNGYFKTAFAHAAQNASNYGLLSVLQPNLQPKKALPSCRDAGASNAPLPGFRAVAAWLVTTKPGHNPARHLVSWP